MAIANNNTCDIVGAEMVDIGLVQGGGEGEAGQGPAGGDEAAGGGEQAHGREEEEDELGQELQDQAVDRRRKEEKEEEILARLSVNLFKLTAEMAVVEGLTERQHMFLIAGVYKLCGKSCMQQQFGKVTVNHIINCAASYRDPMLNKICQ